MNEPITCEFENTTWPNMRIGVEGLGLSLPRLKLTTPELLDRVHPHVPKLRRQRCIALAARLGIRSRHISRDLRKRTEAPLPGQANHHLAARAVRRALDKTESSSIGYLISHTTTPHTLLPPNAAWLADELGYAGPFAEFRQACTGFCNAVIMAHGILNGGVASRVAVVGSEIGSVFFDPASLGTNKSGQLVNFVQMGDGAGAAILSRRETGAYIDRVFFGFSGLHQKPGLSLAAGGSGHPWSDGENGQIDFIHDYESIKTEGLALFDRCAAAARNAGIDIRAVDWILPHQANGILGEFIGPRIGVDPSRFIGNFETVGNLGSASIWAALTEACETGRVQPGQSVLILGAEATKYLYGGFVYHHA